MDHSSRVPTCDEWIEMAGMWRERWRDLMRDHEKAADDLFTAENRAATIADLVRPIAEIPDHGTHYADCHNWHVGCLAARVLELVDPTASQRPNEGDHS